MNLAHIVIGAIIAVIIKILLDWLLPLLGLPAEPLGILIAIVVFLGYVFGGSRYINLPRA